MQTPSARYGPCCGTALLWAPESAETACEFLRLWGAAPDVTTALMPQNHDEELKKRRGAVNGYR